MFSLYLDACCLNRPFDDQTQDRIRLESEAVLLILDRIHRGEWTWVSSDVLIFEISRNPDEERKRRVQLLLGSAADAVALDEALEQRGMELEALGFGAFDALHIASAERAGADLFLTTDERLIRTARRASNSIRTRVENPLRWLNERSEP